MQADRRAGCPQVEVEAHAADWLPRTDLRKTNEGTEIKEGSQVWEAVTKIRQAQHPDNQRAQRYLEDSQKNFSDIPIQLPRLALA
jgi:hypothetical protein